MEETIDINLFYPLLFIAIVFIIIIIVNIINTTIICHSFKKALNTFENIYTKSYLKFIEFIIDKKVCLSITPNKNKPNKTSKTISIIILKIFFQLTLKLLVLCPI